MAKKIILEDSQGNVLHPKTLGECVTTETGETVDGLVSKSQMFSPIIETDSSMSKVGVGTDIDVSLNVKDGAYEECVFEGRSLVNLIPAKTVFEKQAIGGTSGWRNSYLPLTQELKTNTIYTLFYKLETETKVQISIGGKNGDAFLLKSEPIREVGTHYVQTLLTTKPETSNSMSHLYIQFPDNFDVGTVKATNMVLLEGNYMDFNVPYFEGICDSKMPILQNTGENLFDANSPLPDNLNYFYNSDNKNQLTTHAQMLSCAIPVIKGKTYSFYFNHNEIPLKVHKSGVFPTFVSGGVGGVGYAHNVRTITAPIDGYFGIMFCYTENGTTDNWTKVARDWKKQLKLTIVEGESINTYIPYKTNILRTSEEVVLRSLPNGVKDTYNALTGEYVKRIGEVVVTNTVSKSVVVLDNNIRVNIAMSSLNGSNGTTKVNNTLSDKFYWSEANAKDVEGLRVNGNTFHWCVSKNRLTSQDLQGVNTWLQSNPVTIQYELAEPITTIIKPSTIPFAYANGHVVLESGSSEQSLLPYLKYSVVTGRTGQVTQNAKVLRQQEQQIIGLEELLLTQIVQMEYERTLLQFDYELQMMMLG